MATYVRGVENDLTIAQTQRVRDVRDQLAVLEPDAAPFTTVTGRLGSDTTFSVKKEWLEDELPARITKLSANASGGGAVSPAYSTSNTNFSFLVANDSDVLNVDDLLRHEQSGEVVLVTAVGTKGATNADFTVRRNIGNSGSALSPTSGQGQTSTPVGGTDTYIVIGNARQQGAKLGGPVVTQVVAQYNICQILRTPIAVTRTEAKSKNYSGPEYERQMGKAMIVHKRYKEDILLSGRRDLFNASDESTAPTGTSVRGIYHPRGTCGGILAFLGAGTGAFTSDVSAAGTASQKQVDDWLQNSFRYGSSDNKVIICGPLFARLISSYPGNQGLYTTTVGVQASGNIKVPSPDIDHWGVSIKRYQTGLGDSVRLIVARTWADFADAASSSKSLAGSALLLDMDNIDLTYFVGGQTQELQNRQDNDEDISAGEIMSDFTLQVRLMKTHGWMFGLKTASVYS